MFKVKVKERIKEYCNDQIARYNFGMRSQADATRYNNIPVFWANVQSWIYLARILLMEKMVVTMVKT